MTNTMANSKTPSLIVVVILAARQQWYVAGISMVDGSVDCLVRSEPSNLDAYVGQESDAQLSFLRHRLSGALQRGFDRIWAKGCKASRIVMIADDSLPESTPDLMKRLAEHFEVWMTRPPVTFLQGQGSLQIEDLQSLEWLVGAMDDDETRMLQEKLPVLKDQILQSDAWEVIAKPNT